MLTPEFRCPKCGSYGLGVEIPTAYALGRDGLHHDDGLRAIFDNILPEAPMHCRGQDCNYDGLASNFKADTALSLLRELREAHESPIETSNFGTVWFRVKKFLDHDTEQVG